MRQRLEKVEEATAGIQKKLEAKTTECKILEGKFQSMESAKLAEIENKSTEQAMYAEQLKDLEFKLMRSEEIHTWGDAEDPVRSERQSFFG